MWRLSPQGGDFFRREKYYPALDRPQATADAVRQSFQRQKEKSAFGSPGGLSFPSLALLDAPRRVLSSSMRFLSSASKNRPRGLLGRLCRVAARQPVFNFLLSPLWGERGG